MGKLAGKFETPEELENAYTELEKKINIQAEEIALLKEKSETNKDKDKSKKDKDVAKTAREELKEYEDWYDENIDQLTGKDVREANSKLRRLENAAEKERESEEKARKEEEESERLKTELSKSLSNVLKKKKFDSKEEQKEYLEELEKVMDEHPEENLSPYAAHVILESKSEKKKGKGEGVKDNEKDKFFQTPKEKTTQTDLGGGEKSDRQKLDPVEFPGVTNDLSHISDKPKMRDHFRAMMKNIDAESGTDIGESKDTGTE